MALSDAVSTIVLVLPKGNLNEFTVAEKMSVKEIPILSEIIIRCNFSEKA